MKSVIQNVSWEVSSKGCMVGVIQNVSWEVSSKGCMVGVIQRLYGFYFVEYERKGF